MIPFDEEELEYIERLDPAADIELLRRNLPMLPMGCLRTLEVATTLLKRCAAAGLSLSEIGCVCSRSMSGVEEEPSDLERLCEAARAAIDARSDEEEEEEEAVSGSEAQSGDGYPNNTQQQSAESGKPSRYVSGLIPQELVFELEDDLEATSSSAAVFAGPHSPGAASSTDTTSGVPSCSPLDSEGASMLAELSIDGTISPVNSSLPGAPGPRRRESSDIPRGPGLAKSFFPAREALAGYGSLHPAAGLRRVRRRSHSHKRGRSKYPPLVRASGPDSVNCVFEGLDEEDWEEFMEEFCDAVDDALARGVWKTVNKMPVKAGPMSVPF